jgi:molecular chaperone GrpE
VPAGHVAQAWTPGWTLNGRLLKPAMVVVSTGGAQPAGDAPPSGGGTVDTTA